MSWIDRLKGLRRSRPAPAPPPEPVFIARSSLAIPVQSAAAPEVVQDQFPRFQTAAGDQIDARSGDAISQSRAMLRQAFTPSQPIMDRKRFAGRTRVMNAVIRSIEDRRQHVILYGERGIGKTSLLHVLAQGAREARYLVVYVTCGMTSGFDDTLRAAMASIPLLYHADFGPTSAEAERGETLGAHLPSEPLNVRAASDILSRIEGTRVLIVLDEYDRVQSDDFRRNIGELLKSLADQSVRVQFMIAGVASDLTELVTNLPSIQRNVFAVQVPKMTPAEVREVVQSGSKIAGLTFSDGAIAAITARCLGFPYLASMMSHRAALVAIDQRRLNVSADDVVAATRETVEEFAARITRRTMTLIEEATLRGQAGVLQVLAAAAQTTGGWFAVHDIEATPATLEAQTEAINALEDLAAERALIEMRHEDLGPIYRFIEPAASVYLWLLGAQKQNFGLAQLESDGVPT